MIGDMKKISWRPTRLDKKVVVSLYRDGIFQGFISEDGLYTPLEANTSSIMWHIPIDLGAAHDYQLRVQQLDDPKVYADSSIFAIVNPSSDVSGLSHVPYKNGMKFIVSFISVMFAFSAFTVALNMSTTAIYLWFACMCLEFLNLGLILLNWKLMVPASYYCNCLMISTVSIQVIQTLIVYLVVILDHSTGEYAHRVCVVLSIAESLPLGLASISSGGGGNHVMELVLLYISFAVVAAGEYINIGWYLGIVK